MAEPVEAGFQKPGNSDDRRPAPDAAVKPSVPVRKHGKQLSTAHTPLAAAKPGFVVGQPFNPYRLIKRNLLIPEGVARHPGLSPGAKLAYGWLRAYAGQNGVCWPGQERLAQELGRSYRQTQRYLDELEEAALIQPDRDARPGSTPTYYFLCHPVLGPDIDVHGALDTDGQGGLDMDGHRSGSPDQDQFDQASDNDFLAQKNALRQAALCSEATNRETSKEDLSLIRATLTELMEREPDDDILRQVFQAGAGAPATEIVEYLRTQCKRYKPYTAKGPRTMAWFVTVVQSEFRRRRAMEQAASDPLRPRHWSQYRTKADPTFAKALEAIELPDAANAINGEEILE